MAKNAWWFVLALMGTLSARADVPVFGNSPDNGAGFSLAAYDGLSLSGGAVEFTPQENIDLGSVTLWLSGYNGANGESVSASIWGNNNNTPGEPMINFESPAANNGSLAAFTFSDPSVNPFDASGSTELSANTTYWLVVTMGGQPGDYIDGASWVGGTLPGGEAIYGGADSYNVYGGSFDPSSVVPAFGINSDDEIDLAPVVPEPGVPALMLIPVMFAAGRKFCQWRKSRS